jgi:hypothetical protein
MIIDSKLIGKKKSKRRFLNRLVIKANSHMETRTNRLGPFLYLLNVLNMPLQN